MSTRPTVAADVITMAVEILDLQRQLEDLTKENKKLKEDNDQLWDRDQFLCALEANGVDNWCGYGDAQDTIEEWNEEG
jgi:cell division protein FtsB